MRDERLEEKVTKEEISYLLTSHVDSSDYLYDVEAFHSIQTGTHAPSVRLSTLLLTSLI